MCVMVWLLQIKTRDELIIKPLTAQEAGDARDALAKALYSGRWWRAMTGGQSNVQLTMPAA